MQTLLVAVKDSHKRARIISSLRSVRPESTIRQTDALEDVMSLTRMTAPDVLITTLDQQRHATLHLLDDLQISAPQVSVVVILNVEDFELLSHSVRSGGADYLLYPFKDDDLSRLLSSIEEREKALFEASAFTGLLSRAPKNAAQLMGEEALRTLLAGGAPHAQSLACRSPQLDGHLLLTHGEETHELLCSYLEQAHTLYDAYLPEHGTGALLVYPPESEGVRWLRAQLLAALSHIRYGGYPRLDVGVSAPLDQEDITLENALTQARTALSFQFYERNGSLTFYEDVARDLTRDAAVSPVDEASLLKALSAKDAESARTVVRRIFLRLSWPQARPALVLRALNRFCVRLLSRGVDTHALEKALEENLRLHELEQAFERALCGGAQS